MISWDKAVEVLIVDDSAVFRDAVSALLRAHPGMTVAGVAANGLQGLELARQLRPDVVLMDLNMPLLGGIEATRRLKAAPDAPAVVMVTQYDEALLENAAREAGADGWVSKAHLGEKLEAAVRAALQKQRNDQRNDQKGNGNAMSSGNGNKEVKSFNSVKVFSATMAHDREHLGDRVTAWLRQNPHYEIVECRVTQSSDDAFHCLAMTVFYRDPS